MPTGAGPAAAFPAASRIGGLGDGLIEAAGLAAVTLVPLFFNRYSLRAFEPDKTALLRTLALVALAGWLVTALDRGLGPGAWRAATSSLRALARAPLALAVAALALVTLAATVTSVLPATSLWGSDHRLQGAYTTLAYLVLFATMAARLRDPARAERLVTMAILASLPVALYAMAQRWGFDPLTFERGEYTASERVTSHLGNPVFLAGYLAMIWPLALRGLAESLAAARRGASRGPALLRAGLFGLIGATHVAAILFSESRGPFLGWVAGSCTLAVLAGVTRGRRGLVIASAAGTVAIAAGLAAISLAGGPREQVPPLPLFSRFGEALEPSTSGSYRSEIWPLAPRVVSGQDPLEYPDGRRDPWHRLRPLLGYGPETQSLAIRRVSFGTGLDQTLDRFHSHVWDTLVTTGVAGVLAALAVFAAIVAHGLSRVGLFRTRARRTLFWAIWVAGGLAGALGLGVWRGLGFAGPGLQLGIAGGMIAGLVALGTLEFRAVPLGQASDPSRSLTIALLAGLVAHIVETSVSFPVTATSTVFWAWAGLLGSRAHALPRPDLAPVESATDPAPVGREVATATPARAAPARGVDAPGMPPRSGCEPAAVHGVLLALCLGTLGFVFIGPGTSTSAIDLLADAFLGLPGRPSSWYVPAMLALVWVAGAVALSTDPDGAPAPRTWRAVGMALAVSLALILPWWIWQAGNLAAVSRLRPAEPRDALALVRGYERLVLEYAVWLLVLLGLLSVLLAWPGFRMPRPRRLTALVSLPIIIGTALAVAAATNLRPIQADVAAARGLRD